MSRLDRRTRAARAQARDGREALLAAAERVFARRGYRDASVDEIAGEAGFSKGAVYWHFAGKEDLFFALVDERIDRPVREAIAELESAPPGEDMAERASALFAGLLRRRRELFLLDREYWSLAMRDPRLCTRYAARQRDLRRALAAALRARVEHLGRPIADVPLEEIATALLGLAHGLTHDRLVDPDAVPEHILGDTFALIYAGLVARAS
ncbi:MAG TPA: TetR/AcrR family transcriptional regulator [Solirubrobacteraceae bacterium]